VAVMVRALVCAGWLLLGLAAMALQIFPADAPTMPAQGRGMIDTLPVNGGIRVPEIERRDPYPAPGRGVYGVKGPMRGVRTYRRVGNNAPVLVSAQEFDRRGRLVRDMQYANGVAREKTLIRYSPRGNRTEIHYSTDRDLGFFQVSGYDTHNRLVTFTSRMRHLWEPWGKTEHDRWVYDNQNRKVHFFTDACPDTRREWVRYTPAGQIAHTETVNLDQREATTYAYDAQGRMTALHYVYFGASTRDVAWQYGKNTVITIRHRGANPSLERLTYTAAGHLLTHEWYAWSYKRVNADGTDAWISTPIDERVGEMPLYRRSVYSYDGKGRLLGAAHFDGSGTPANANYSLRDMANPDGRGFARVEYCYTPDGLQWTAYGTDGQIARRRQDSPTTRKTGYGYSSSEGFPWHVVRLRLNSTPQPHDRYGNWLREAYDGSTTTFRIFTYY
jgi:YD repeat-containing protein